jgi:hypothetical protein
MLSERATEANMRAEKGKAKGCIAEVADAGYRVWFAFNDAVFVPDLDTVDQGFF